jgi:serine kinase of HPr protein (carbohydrate metabolism regulator)
MNKDLKTIVPTPIFSKLINPFLKKNVQYQVVHYRIEKDFSNYFYKRFKFESPEKCEEYLFAKYNEYIRQHFDLNIPILIVSNYFKEHDTKLAYHLKFPNIIHYLWTDQDERTIRKYLGINNNQQMREIYAFVDYLVATSPNSIRFIGLKESTFSRAIENRCEVSSFLISLEH